VSTRGTDNYQSAPRRGLQGLTLSTVLVLAVLCLGASTAHAATQFKAAVAKVDITPPAGLPMYGFFDRLQQNRVATGTLDPLYARVLVLEAGDRHFALLTLDLGRTFSEPLLDQLRQQIRSAAGISFLMITASHTHSGPNLLDEYPGGRPPEWERRAIQTIASAVAQASQHLVPAKIGTGAGEVEIGYNRRLVRPDGTVTMLSTDPGKQPTLPVDPTVLVMRIDDLQGKPLAIVVNYACHPVVLGSDNLQYSADFVGVMAHTVEAAFGGAPICLFVQGADGDINPYYATTPLKDGGVARRDWTGEQLGAEAARVANNIQPSAPTHAAIDFSDDVLRFQLRWRPHAFREGLLAKYGPKIFEDHADLIGHDPPPDHLDLHVTTLLLNHEIALVGMPGESFVDLQVDWRARCPVQAAFFAGYANGYFDYLPTIAAAAEGGYGAGDSNTYVEVGAGERMLRHALVRVYEILGKLSDAPERN
jgi:neutral ceramidase